VTIDLLSLVRDYTLQFTAVDLKIKYLLKLEAYSRYSFSTVRVHIEWFALDRELRKLGTTSQYLSWSTHAVVCVKCSSSLVPFFYGKLVGLQVLTYSLFGVAIPKKGACGVPHQRAVFISPPPQPSPDQARGGSGGCQQTPFRPGMPSEPRYASRFSSVSAEF